MGILYSMTGFGQAQGELSQRLSARIRVTSLNSRSLEVIIRTRPRMDTSELDIPVKNVLGEKLNRGRVQMVIELEATAGATAQLRFNWRVAEMLLAELGRKPAELEVAPLALRDLLALPGFAEGTGELILDEGEQEALLGLLAQARDELLQARAREAAALLPQIKDEIAKLESFHAWLVETNPQVRSLLLTRLRERVSELVSGMSLPEDRMLAETALLADRADVSEEIQRLSAHLRLLHQLLDKGGAVGKKLDFLSQELLREVNTAASKCREVGMGERVVEAKAAVEKLREQFANLE